MAESIRSLPSGFEGFRRVFTTAAEWCLHLSLFLLTVLSTTFAGIMLATPPDLPVPTPRLSGPLDYLLYLPFFYLSEVTTLAKYALVHPGLIVDGLTFSFSLIAILFSHEMGHYLACRFYRVDATLPYFIPAPPLFLAGTFGAFIKIRSPIPSRRALFDIGLAGPLAGFVIAVPVSIVGILNMGPPVPLEGSAIIFNDPL